MSLARPARALRPLENGLQSIQPMVASGHLGQGAQSFAVGSRRRGLHYRRLRRSSASRRFGRKRGIKENALGRSRGGFSTKVHALVDTQGRPLHVELTPGQQHDCTVAKEIIAVHAQGKAVIADTAYDSDDIIAQVRAQQMKPVICPHPRRKTRPRLDRKNYRKRYRVEVFFHDIKRFRAIATRFEKRALHYLSVVQLVSALVWLPQPEAAAS